MGADVLGCVVWYGGIVVKVGAWLGSFFEKWRKIRGGIAGIEEDGCYGNVEIKEKGRRSFIGRRGKRRRGGTEVRC